MLKQPKQSFFRYRNYDRTGSVILMVVLGQEYEFYLQILGRMDIIQLVVTGQEDIQWEKTLKKITYIYQKQHRYLVEQLICSA